MTLAALMVQREQRDQDARLLDLAGAARCPMMRSPRRWTCCVPTTPGSPGRRS